MRVPSLRTGARDAERASSTGVERGRRPSPAVAETHEHRLREAQLALAHRLPDWGSWTWDMASDALSASERFTSLLGVERDTPLRMEDALAAMPEEDRTAVQAAIQRVLDERLDSFSIEYRLTAAGGTTRWLQAYCDAVRDADGQLTHVLGITTDITERVLATEAIAQVSAFWQGTLDSLSAHIAVLDERGEIVSVNRSWRLFAAAEGGCGDYVGSNYVAICRAAEEPLASQIADGLDAILDGRRSDGEWKYACHDPDGRRRWFLLRATRYQGAGPVRVVLAHENVTQRHVAQEEAAMQASLLGEIDAAVMVTSLERVVLEWSEGAERQYGWTRGEAIGRRLEELIVPDAHVDPIVAELMERGNWEGELPARRKDGSVLTAYCRTRVLSDEHGEPRALAGVSIDISKAKEAERELASARDYLRAVTDSMGQALFTLDHDGRAQYLNPVAEGLLGWSTQELKGRLIHPLVHHRRADGSALPPEECPIRGCRLKGDVVRVEDDVFIRADGSELPVAYTACPFTTADGTEGCVVVFEDISARKAEARRVAGDLEKLAWTRRVQDALTLGHFVLYAQPIIDLRTGRTVQQELLIRMLDPGSPDVIAPGSFLPAAEELGLIGEIDRWVIDRSAEFAAAGSRVELNVSARSISDPRLLDYIEQAIERNDADPRMMVFEITETAVASDECAAFTFVECLHRLGCKIALDDFGTGFGTFTYLKQLPIDYLKIDIEFVRDLRDNPASRKVVEAVVSLAEGFGLQTVAEGVEDAESIELLKQLRVDYAQGYYIGRPAPFQANGAADRLTEAKRVRRQAKPRRPRARPGAGNH